MAAETPKRREHLVVLTLDIPETLTVVDALRRRQADELEEVDADLNLARRMGTLADQLVEAAWRKPEPEGNRS